MLRLNIIHINLFICNYFSLNNDTETNAIYGENLHKTVETLNMPSDDSPVI